MISTGKVDWSRHPVARHWWVVVKPGARRTRVLFVPAQTLAEVRAWYPGCDVQEVLL